MTSPTDPPRIIVAPTDFLPLLQECVLGVMHDAAEEVEHARFDVEAYQQPLARLDRIRALLDVTNWGEHGDIDLSEHREALQDALSDRLATERDMQVRAGEAPKDDEGRQRAYRYGLEIEAFMAEAGLEIPRAGEQDA